MVYLLGPFCVSHAAVFCPSFIRKHTKELHVLPFAFIAKPTHIRFEMPLFKHARAKLTDLSHQELYNLS